MTAPLPGDKNKQPRLTNLNMTGLKKGELTKMKKYLPFIITIILFAFIHEGAHAAVAYFLDEYAAFKVHFYGFEVIYKTPVTEREGIVWGYVAGISNMLTLITGYIFFIFRKVFMRIPNRFFNQLCYWVIFVFVLFDAFNLSIIPFFFGGDIGGLAHGLGINRYLIQSIFFVILLINRELIIHKLFPLYGIKTKHILFQPILKVKGQGCSEP